MTLNRKKSDELQALLDRQAEMEREIKEAEKTQEAKEAIARKASKKNGAAYAGLVLDLYELLGIEPEHPRVRKSGDGGRDVEISTDPADGIRLGRLRGMLEEIIGAADQSLLDELKRADEAGRDERRDERERSKRSPKAAGATAGTTGTKRAEAGAEADDEDIDEEEEVSTGPALAGPNWA